MNLKRAVDLFLGEHIDSTRLSYMYVLRQMYLFTGQTCDLESITSDKLIEYTQALRRKDTIKSPATFNKHVKTIRTFFNWCIKNNFISEPSPAIGIRLMRQKKSIDRDRAMPEPIYEQLLDFAKWKTRYLALVLFLGDTGCRIGGAAGLRWNEIDFDNRRAVVTEKGEKTRPVFFGEECAAALLRWRRQATLKKGDYVFSLEGGRMNNDSLGQLFERICSRAEIGQWGPHSLRHRKGHQFADAKVAPSIAAKAMGHANPLTTLEYYYPDDWDRVQEELEKLAHSKPTLKDQKVLRFEQKSAKG